jgi:hypothetical protein
LPLTSPVAFRDVGTQVAAPRQAAAAVRRPAASWTSGIDWDLAPHPLTS